MAITTLDGLVAALPGQQRNGFKTGTAISVAGQYYFFGPAAGSPSAMNAPGAIGSNGNIYDHNFNSGYPFTNPVANGYLARAMISSPAPITAFIYDLVWGVSWTPTVTGPQAITFPTVPARDMDGTANGGGMELWYVPWTTIGAAAGTITVTYTNSAGTLGQVTSPLSPVTAGALGRAQPFTLAPGDKGVKSIQSINSSATMTSGTPSILMMRRIASIPIPVANKGEDRDWAQLGFPRVYAGTALQLMALTTTTTTLSPLLIETNIADG